MKTIDILFYSLLVLFMAISNQIHGQNLKMGIIGLSHDHIGFMGNPDFLAQIDIVGVAETNDTLLQKYARQFSWSQESLYTDWAEMLDAQKPDAVMVFTSPFQHLEVVTLCAPRKIHVMVEKPFAVSMEHAQQMANLAREHNIHLLTNYETTWYASNHKAYEVVHLAQAIGPLRKIVVHDGHYGPKELGCTPAFLEWLLDPVQNGGGALTDFGCYGANLITWLMEGRRPISVLARTQQIKKDPAYAKVDDEATIILTYPKAQGIIQASWNWPYNRKDMEVYGHSGYIHPINGDQLRFRPDRDSEELDLEANPRSAPFDNPVNYFVAVIREEISPEGSLSSLENNLIVTEILDAARKSAEQGIEIKLE